MSLFSKKIHERVLRLIISGNKLTFNIRDHLNNIIWEHSLRISYKNNPATTDLIHLIPKKIREGLTSFENNVTLKIKNKQAIHHISRIECYVSSQFISTYTTVIKNTFSTPTPVTHTTIDKLNNEMFKKQELLRDIDTSVLFYDHIANITIDGYYTSNPLHKSATHIRYTLVTSYINTSLLNNIISSVTATFAQSDLAVLPEFTLCNEFLPPATENESAFVVFMGEELIELFEVIDNKLVSAYSLNIGMNDVISEIVHLTHYPFSHIKSILSNRHLYEFFIESNKKSYDRIISVCVAHKERYFDSATALTSRKLEAPIYIYSQEEVSNFWLSYLTAIMHDANVSHRRIIPITTQSKNSLFHSSY
jgi:hypothetical protein